MRYPKVIFFFFLLCISCQPDQAKTSSVDKKPRPLNKNEALFVGSWSTVFRDTEGNVYVTNQTKGNYLEFRKDRSYFLYKDNNIIRNGEWAFDEQKKMLNLQTKLKSQYYYVESLEKDTIDLIDQKHLYKLTYIPYQPFE